VSGIIEYEKLYKLLKKKLRRARIYLVDRKYQIISKKEMMRFLEEDKTDLIKYIPEFRDCDDISWALLGNINSNRWSGIAFGFAFSKVHAFNIFCDSKKVYIIEPQTDKIMEINKIPSKHKKAYWPILIVMM